MITDITYFVCKKEISNNCMLKQSNKKDRSQGPVDCY